MHGPHRFFALGGLTSTSSAAARAFRHPMNGKGFTQPYPSPLARLALLLATCTLLEPHVGSNFQILILPRLGPRPCRAVPPSGRAPALAKLKFAKFFERTNERTTKLSSKSRTDLRSCVPGAKLVKESDFDIKSRLAPPKSTENDKKHLFDKCFLRQKNRKLQIL